MSADVAATLAKWHARATFQEQEAARRRGEMARARRHAAHMSRLAALDAQIVRCPGCDQLTLTPHQHAMEASA